MSNFTLFNNDTAKSQNSAQSVGDSFYERVGIMCVLVLLSASICGCAFLYDECIKVLEKKRKEEEKTLVEGLKIFRECDAGLTYQAIKDAVDECEGRERSNSS